MRDMPSVDRCAIPELPEALLVLLRELDPEAKICLKRKGGKTYEPLADFFAPPLFEMCAKMIATFVRTSVDEDSDGYFRVESGGMPNYSWYAFKPEAGTSAAPSNEHLTPIERETIALLAATVDSYARFMNLQPEYSKATINVLKQCAKQMKQTNKALRKVAADSSEVLIASMEENRKTEREKMGMELFRDWMDKNEKRDSTAQMLIQQLCALLEPDDYEALRNHDVAKELFTATSAMAFRDAAQECAHLFEKGELPVGELATSRLALWLPKVLGGPSGS